jgi:hypothetical protein
MMKVYVCVKSSYCRAEAGTFRYDVCLTEMFMWSRGLMSLNLKGILPSQG